MMPQVMMMTASLPVELTIGASSRKEGLPTVKVGDSLTLGLTRLSNASSRWHNEGAISITDPFGLQVVKIPFRLGRYTRGQFRVPLHKNLLSGIYTVTVGFVDSAFKDLSTKEAPSKVIGENPRVFGCFRLEGGHPPSSRTRSPTKPRFGTSQIVPSQISKYSSLFPHRCPRVKMYSVFV
jgi:hypothetical protein